MNDVIYECMSNTGFLLFGNFINNLDIFCTSFEILLFHIFHKIRLQR